MKNDKNVWSLVISHLVKYLENNDINRLSSCNKQLYELIHPHLYIIWGFRPWLTKFPIESRYIAGIFSSFDTLIQCYSNKLINDFKLFLNINDYNMYYYNVSCVRLGVPFSFPSSSFSLSSSSSSSSSSFSSSSSSYLNKSITQHIMSNVNDLMTDITLMDYHIEHEVKDYMLLLKLPLSKTLSVSLNQLYLMSYYENNIDYFLINRTINHNKKKRTLILERQKDWKLVNNNVYLFQINVI